MGREVRMVPANWDHPQRDERNNRYGHGGYQPMHDQNFDERFAEWLADFDRFRANGPSESEREYYPRGLADWLQGDGAPPDPTYYRPWRDEDATWFQVWETVSEWTPVTPPFETREALVDYLVEHGDFWQQKRWKEGDRFMQPKPPGHSREAAEQFVMGDGWAPSMVVIRDEHGVRTAEGIDIPHMLSQEPRQ
jgi:hypothetical protein